MGRSLRDSIDRQLAPGNNWLQPSDEVMSTSRSGAIKVKVGGNGVPHEPCSQETSQRPWNSVREGSKRFGRLPRMAPVRHADSACHLLALVATKKALSLRCKPRDDCFYVLLRSLGPKLSQIAVSYHPFLHHAECAPRLVGGPGGRTWVRFRSWGFEGS